MTRAFIALEIPEAIRVKIHETFAPVRRQLSGVKWAEPSVMHLTLRFLGEVEEEILEKEISQRLREVCSQEPAFPLRCKGVGVFPTVYKPRVFWVGVEGDGGVLQRLQDKIEKALAGFPVHSEEKAFHAHLTLGRVKVPDRKNAWPRILEEYEKIDLGSLRVEEVVLFKSELTRTGPNYTKLQQFKLQA
jgi:RNA 2',3'-cyclic 3'-phosphodiesterase